MADQTRIGRKAEIMLGQQLEKLRLRKGLTRTQLGQKVNKPEQQIAKYEAGEFVPIPMLENLAAALDEPIQKKIIRRISFLRKLEIETKQEQEGLMELYEALFDDLD